MTTSVICPVCNRTIGSNAGLQAHMRSMHREEWRRDQEAKIEPATAFRGARPAVPPPSPPSNGVRWEDPPERISERGARLIEKLKPLFPELRRHPGRWARILEYDAKQSAWSTRHTLLKAKQWPRDIELKACAVDSGGAVFARFVESED